MTRLALTNAALAAALACLVGGCSEVGFPAVHDMPSPRAETPMTPDQIKQVTDNLICEREHLATEAQASPQPANPPGQPQPPAKPPCVAPQTTGSLSAQPASAYARP